MASPRILLAEDDPVTAGMLEHIFSFEGYRTESIMTAEKVEAAVKDGSYDAVVLDLNLRGMTPEELVSRVGEVFPRPPIIIFSACPMRVLEAAAQALGSAAILQKPAGMEQ